MWFFFLQLDKYKKVYSYCCYQQTPSDLEGRQALLKQQLLLFFKTMYERKLLSQINMK